MVLWKVGQTRLPSCQTCMNSQFRRFVDPEMYGNNATRLHYSQSTLLATVCAIATLRGRKMLHIGQYLVTTWVTFAFVLLNQQRIQVTICFSFQNGSVWSNKDPVAFQQWKNYNFGNYFVCYELFQISTNIFALSTKLSAKYWTHAAKKTTKYKSDATNELYPLVLKTKLCVALFLSNLATPEWIPVTCDDQISPNVLCHIWNPRFKLSSVTNTNNYGCYGFQIIKNNTCLSFLYIELKDNVRAQWKKQTVNFPKNVWNSSCITTFDLKNIKDLHFLFEAVSVTFPPLIVHYFDVEFTFAIYVQQWFLSEVSYAMKVDPKGIELVGFHILQSEYSHQPFGNNLFVCKSKDSISSKYVCDNHNDCSDGSDENECTCSLPNEKSICSSFKVYEGKEICSSLYYKTRSGTCSQYTSLYIQDELYPIPKSHNKTTFTCTKYEMDINANFLDDLVPDCISAADEPLLKNLLRHKNVSNCTQQHHIPCFQGHKRCFDVENICTFELNVHGFLIPCRTGSHLESCEAFECNMKFKCKGFYCIPWAYVCNGKWDCPFGFDEDKKQNCKSHRKCTQLYRCRESFICIHVGDLCDEKADCPLGDDEDMCQAHKTKCPEVCLCMAFAISCFHTSLALYVLPHKFTYLSASFSFCVLSPINAFFQKVKSVSLLDVSNNNISFLCNVPSQLEHLTFALFTNNTIASVQEQCFSNLRSLRMVHLGQNIIFLVQSQSFNNLTTFMSLNVSINKLTCIEHTWIIFSNEQNPMLLSVRENPFQHIDDMLFSRLPVKVLDTNDYRLCCIFPLYDDCSSLKPWYISCSNLLTNPQVQAVFIIVDYLILASSIFSIIAQTKSIRMKKHTSQTGDTGKKVNICFEANVIGIHLCDTLFVIYLGIIWVADLAYQNTFVLVGDKWRAGGFCFLSFALVLIFSFASPLLFEILAFSRFDAVHQPIRTKFKEIKFVLKCFSAIFSLSLFLATSFTCAKYFVHKSVSVSLCLPLADPSDSGEIFKIILGLICSLQMFSSAFVACSHVKLVQELKKSTSQFQTREKQKGQQGVIFQLLLISFSNNISWLPACVIFSVFSFLAQYPTDIVMWTVVAIMPVNSILAALIFCFVTVRGLLQSKIQKCK